MTTQVKKNQQPLQGKVVSNKMDQTVVVLITDTVKHPTYQKYVKRYRKIKAHDESNQCQIDDTVLLVQAKPYSKHKAWKVEKVIK